MRLSHLPLVALAWVVQAQAAEEFGATIPIELARIMIGLDPSVGAIYADVPAEFPAFDLPAGMTALGSIVRASTDQILYLQAEEGVADARSDLADALSARGWRLAEFGRPPTPSNVGFVGRELPASPALLCHDTQGQLRLGSLSRPDGTAVLVLTWQAAAASMRDVPTLCAQVMGRARDAMRQVVRVTGLETELPRLELPREASTGMPAGATGRISGGSDEATASTPLLLDWELGAVTAHFTTQIEAQGWTKQGEWNTPQLAGASWSRTDAEGQPLLGTLSVIRKAPGAFQLDFRLLALPRPEGN